MSEQNRLEHISTLVDYLLECSELFVEALDVTTSLFIGLGAAQYDRLFLS